MGQNEIRVGDYGTTFVATVKDGDNIVNLSSATTKQFKIKRPDGVVLTKDVDFVTDGSDGKLTYTIASGDLTMGGIWKLQGFAVTPLGSWKSDIYKFHVENNLETD